MKLGEKHPALFHMKPQMEGITWSCRGGILMNTTSATQCLQFFHWYWMQLIPEACNPSIEDLALSSHALFLIPRGSELQLDK